ncbi:MAG TPA: hypothetical protein VK253_09140, partial [Candidatus Binatia bacterium]|nr:hypothetical protein [Candidatus Binatia bacterium]
EVYKSWDITADVKTALTLGTLTEVLKFASKTGDGYAIFQSREATNRPKLEVEYSTKPISVVHLESIQDTGATNNLGLITIANNVFSFPTDIDVVTGSYQIAYSGGYMFMRWETSGGVTVSNANAATATMTVSGSGILRAVGDVTRLEYSYDHEQAGLELQSAGYIDAVRFTPLFSDKLLIARFYMYYISSYTSNTFKVHVMDENRNDIITPFTQTPTATGWFDVDLSSYGIRVNAGTDFYIGMEWITGNPYLGEDTSSNFDRSWYWNGTNLQQETYGDFMIRAVTGLTYSLAISTTAGGSTIPTSGSYVYNAGTSVSARATALAGYLFDHWELDGVSIGSTNPYTFTIKANHTLQGIFTALPPTPTPSPTPTSTPSPTPTPSSTPTSTSTSTPTSAPTPVVTPTLAPTQTTTPTPSTSSTLTPSSQPYATPTPTAIPNNPQFVLPAETTYAIAALFIVVAIVAITLVLFFRKRAK